MLFNDISAAVGRDCDSCDDTTGLAGLLLTCGTIESGKNSRVQFGIIMIMTIGIVVIETNSKQHVKLKFCKL
jgi:hypothetical protein